MPVTLRPATSGGSGSGGTGGSAPGDASGVPRVALSVTLTSGVVPSTASITRLDPDGVSRPVRLAEPATLTHGVWSGYDYESPFGVSLLYTITGDTGATATISARLDVPDVWLRSPGQPELSCRIGYQGRGSMGSRTRKSTQAALTPFGRSSPIIVSGPVRQSASSSLLVLTQSLAERAALWALLETDAVLLLTIPPAKGWGLTNEYISIGDAVEERPGAVLPDLWRQFTLPYQVVDRPAGDLRPLYTWDDVDDDFPTWGAVAAANATWGDLAARRPA